MQVPSLPNHEKERLAALKQLEVLDTAPEEAFDDFTFLASNICGTPIALITLLDETRQWFKSKIGVDASETPREISFCGHAILQHGIFEVPDALADTRFMGNPLVMGEPKIRFYAGIPIQTKEGFNLGTLCVIDTTPRKLTDTQRNALKSLARQVMVQIELQQAFKNNQQLNQTLSETARFSKNIIDNIPATIGYWDKNLICRYANKTYAEKYSKQGIEIVGKALTEAASAELMQQIKPHIDGVFKGVPQKFEASFTTPSKQVIKTQVNYIPDIGQHGDVDGFYIFAHDITALRQAEEENKLAEIAIETSHTAVLITNSQHQIVSVNHVFLEMTGFSQQELIGKTPDYIFDVDSIQKVFASFQANQDWRGEGKYRKKSGEWVDHYGTLNMLRNEKGEVTHHLATITDLTEKRRLQQELAITQEMLERTGKIANVGGWEYDFSNNKVRWTEQVYVIHELESREPPSHEGALSFYTEEAAAKLQSAIHQCIEFDIPWDLELPFISAKGNHLWVRTMGEVLKENGVKTKIAGTFQDITHKKLLAQSALAKEIELRQTVVREVHHHIKNNIQGLSGILHNAIYQHPELSTPINDAISQLQSVAVIHGLQGQSLESMIEINELTSAISQNIEGIWQKKVYVESLQDWTDCHLSKDEAVPVALILNELITNAVKHSNIGAPVTVTISQALCQSKQFEVNISVTNSGDFSFTPNLDRENIHFGLKLIQSLMPKVGAYHYISSLDNKTQAVLVLRYPIIKAEHAAQTSKRATNFT